MPQTNANSGEKKFLGSLFSLHANLKIRTEKKILWNLMYHYNLLNQYSQQPLKNTRFFSLVF